MKIEVCDYYDSGKRTSVYAKFGRGLARPWISDKARRAANKRIGLTSGSCLRATGELIDVGFDRVDVYDGRGLLTDEIRAF